MDFTHSQSNLSLGFLSHSSHTHAQSSPHLSMANSNLNSNPNPNSRSLVTDDSISFQIDSRLRESSNPISSIPLQLLEQSAQIRRKQVNNGGVEIVAEQQHKWEHDETNTEERENGKGGDNGGDDDDGVEVEEFRILGHPMCLKRRRDREDSASSSTIPVKRVLIDSNSSNSSLESRRCAVKSWGNQSIRVADPEIFDIMEKEKQRQYKGIELIASENFVCKAVMEALGSHLTNKYSEGMPGTRYYGGNQYIDEIETMCCERALAAFDLSSENWGVNVQPYSCTSANFAVYTGLLSPGDRIMGLDTLSGGNTSHGCHTPHGRKVSGASIFFESFPYKINPQTGCVDYDKLEEKALDYRPKILICGGSSYPREWDYARLRQTADKCGAILMCDMAQISGLIAAKECANPFDFCDIVTSTTHKSLRGPRGGIIFFRKGKKPRKRGSDDSELYDFEEKINFGVFPALQGGPHNNHIAALAIALRQVATPEYKTYMQQVKRNAQALASALLRRKCKIVTGGTDNHLVLWDLTPLGLTGKNFEKVCETCHITVNKVALFGDNGAITPGGVRIGTPAMTTRGCLEPDFEVIADFLIRAAQITSLLQREQRKAQKSFVNCLQNNKDIVELRTRIEAFATQFAMPGFDM